MCGEAARARSATTFVRVILARSLSFLCESLQRGEIRGGIYRGGLLGEGARVLGAARIERRRSVPCPSRSRRGRRMIGGPRPNSRGGIPLRARGASWA
jgi:hypothetical protein